MSLALKVYELFKEDEKKAKALAEVFEEIEGNFSRKDQSVRLEDLEQTKLGLILEIEKVRSEIEKVRGEIKEVEGRLSLEIKEVEGRLTLEIEKSRSDILKYMNRQTIWVISAVSVIIGALRALDYFLK